MKYLLDTCVISELIKPTPNTSVVAWFELTPDDNLYLSSIAIGEIAQGFESLPASRRRRTYEKWFRESVEAAYAGRILNYDSSAAKRWALITATASANGHPRPAIDAMVAAIASVHDMTVVTRNVEHLKYTGVPVVNPFESEQKENPTPLIERTRPVVRQWRPAPRGFARSVEMLGVGNLTQEMHRRSEASKGTRSRKRSPEGAARRCAYANSAYDAFCEIGKISNTKAEYDDRATWQIHVACFHHHVLV